MTMCSQEFKAKEKDMLQQVKKILTETYPNETNISVICTPDAIQVSTSAVAFFSKGKGYKRE